MDKFSTYRAQYEEQFIKAAKSFKSATAQIDAKYVLDMRNTRQNYNLKLTAIQKRLREIVAFLGSSAVDWPDKIWDSHIQNNKIPVGIRIGTGILKGQFENLEVPVLVQILNRGNLIFIAKGAAKKTAIQALQSSLLKIVATFQPEKLKLILVDPVGLGANVAGFMNLPEKIIGNKAWTEPRDIEQQLADLTAHMENVIMKYLRNDYKTMEEYNQQAGEVAEPYRFLTVLNFPANFTDDSAKRLLSIALNGPRTGVYVILTIDAELPLPYGFNLEDLLTTGSVFESNEGGEFTWKVAELEKLELRLDKPPATEKFNKIISPIPNLLSDDRVEVPFEKICPPDLEWWQGDASSKFRVPLGRRGAREKQFLEFGTNTAHHGLLTGKTGAGKSNLLHVIIINSALIYSPEELVLYLIDFKEGVEFKDYADYKLPHARVVGIESEREFGLSVLREIEQEINRRGVLFKQANAAHDLHEYRSNTGNKLPRIFLIIDEFQRLFSEEDVLASQSSHILAHIIQQGRVFGINVLLASQTLADAYAVGRSTYDQMSVRIALQSTEADSRQILGDNNSAARLLNRPGEAIYNAQNGLEAGNNIFQVAWLPHKKPQDKREHYLEKIKILAEKSHINPPFQQVVFEGDKPSQISKNKELWTTLQTKQKPIVQSAFKVYLGESTEINPPHTEAYIRPQGRSNMMIIGQNERSAFSLISTAWLSLSAYSIAKPLEFYVVDFSRADDTWATMLPRLQKILPNTATVVRQRDFEKMITQVDKILSQRMENNDLAERRIFFILAGLHRARELRATDEYGSFSETAQSLGKICREGPDLGVHVIGWCDTFGNLTRLADRKTIAEFDIRVAMQMSEDDSNQFIESPRAKSLGSNRAYLYDMDKIGRLEKFRPYELITDDELDEIEFFFGKKEKI